MKYSLWPFFTARWPYNSAPVAIYSRHMHERGRANLKLIEGRTQQSKFKIRFQNDEMDPYRFIPLGERDLAIGDFYAGGIVGSFFEKDPEDPERPRGLIVSEINSDTRDQGEKQWHSTLTVAVGLEKDANKLKGAGKTNTDKILAIIGSDNAAGIADSFSVWSPYYGTGQPLSDWFLPSIQELEALHANESEIGGFIDGHAYWSSTESYESSFSKEGHAMGTHMGPGGATNAFKKTDSRRVRVVRYF